MIFDENQIYQVVDNVRANRGKIIFTNGCFDVFHIGHLNTIKYAADIRRIQDILIVGINSDESVKALKGDSRPIFCFEDRASIIDSIRWVDHVVKFNDPSVYDVIKIIEPDILVKGGSTGAIVGQDFVNSKDGIVVRAPLIENASTTKIVEKLNV